MNRTLRLLLGLAVLGGLVALAWTPIQLTRAISQCDADLAACAASADTLCAHGARGTDALLEHVGDLSRASEPMRALAFAHAACDSTSSEADRVARLATTLTGASKPTEARRGETWRLPDPIQYALFARLTDAGVHLDRLPPKPDPESTAAVGARWCEAVLPRLPRRLAESPDPARLPGMAGFEVFSALTARDCGPATDAALTAVLKALYAPQITAEAALVETHGGYTNQANIAIKKAKLARSATHIQPGVLTVQLSKRAKQSGQPWRWLKPLFEVPMACSDRGHLVYQLADLLALKGWSTGDHAALVATLLPHLERCESEHSSSRLKPVFEALPAHQEAMLEAIAAGRPHCDSVSSLSRLLDALPREAPTAKATEALGRFRAEMGRCLR